MFAEVATEMPNYTSFGVLGATIFIVVAFLQYLKSRDTLNREAAKEGHEAATALRTETAAMREAVNKLTEAVERMQK